MIGDDGADYHQRLILPAALELLALRAGERVIDLCCGQGVFARAALTAGASAVLGVDASPRLIEAARQRTAGSGAVRFEAADVRHPGPWADGSFDAGACLMAVQDVDQPGGLFASLAASLRPGGRAAIVMMHPCFRIPRQSGWGWDDEKKSQYRRIDRYATPLDVPISTAPRRAPGAQTVFHHRPLAEYLTLLGSAGLMVNAARELCSHRRADSGPRARAENRAATEIPLFLAFRCVRA
ncbi:MAG: class I SAM-dependent methyltransferase [Planctomycetia bacterium]|nr:MAG: class I SAM-dependent methyltransferase [Planctomycetia bacterium]